MQRKIEKEDLISKSILLLDSKFRKYGSIIVDKPNNLATSPRVSFEDVFVKTQSFVHYRTILEIGKEEGLTLSFRHILQVPSPFIFAIHPTSYIELLWGVFIVIDVGLIS